MTTQLATIYLIRHGESEFNREGRVQGQADSPLSELGVRQARRLQERFATKPLTAVYSSPLQRCRAMAEYLVEQRDIPIVYVKELMEQAFGEWEPLFWEEANRLFPEERRRVQTDAYAAPPGGESAVEVWDRVQVAWQTILSPTHGDVAVVCHGGVIKMLLGSLLGLPREGPLSRYAFSLGSAGVSTLKVTEGSVSDGSPDIMIFGVNDDRHLDGLAREGWRAPLRKCLRWSRPADSRRLTY